MSCGFINDVELLKYLTGVCFGFGVCGDPIILIQIYLLGRK
jgi:hypothetical protein